MTKNKPVPKYDYEKAAMMLAVFMAALVLLGIFIIVMVCVLIWFGVL